jgi:hypothetical protein
MVKFYINRTVSLVQFAPLRSLCILLFLLTAAILSSAQKVSRIKINASNAALYRDTLNKKIFGPAGFPYSILPNTYTSNVTSIDHYAGFPYSSIMFPAGNLDSIDRMAISVDANITNFPSQVKTYLFHPHNSNGKLFIYHAGHCAGVAISEDVMVNGLGTDPGLVIPQLIAAGYTVLAVPMFHYQFSPFDGYVCGYNRHDEFFADNLYTFPLGYFFKPLAASLNQLGRSNYSAIYMCGLSGGGWATSVYPALDSSIQISVPVAGSWPMPLRQVFFTDGDSEQAYPPIYSQFLDYHELYTLACLAPARKMLQINNRLDPCCYNNAGAHVFYVDSVNTALQGSGGVFRFYLDETINRHAISQRSMKLMLTFINGGTAGIQNQPLDTITGLSAYSYNAGSNFVVNGTPDPTPLQYSLLKGPSWMQMNGVTGELYGTVPADVMVPVWDTVSFKAEDVSGRFVIHNYIMTRKREKPFFFTMYTDSNTVYFQPFFSKGMSSVSNMAVNYFYTNNPGLILLSMDVMRGSLIRMRFNQPVSMNDSIGYSGLSQPGSITYNNGLPMENFPLNPIQINRVTAIHARMGMIRFNTDSNKFEYFNGTTWINMH